MTFWVRGKMRGRTQTVTWSDGTLAGDLAACAEIKRFDKVIQGVAVGLPEGPRWTENRLSHFWGALFLVRHVFGKVLAEGVTDPPPLPYDSAADYGVVR